MEKRDIKMTTAGYKTVSGNLAFNVADVTVPLLVAPVTKPQAVIWPSTVTLYNVFENEYYSALQNRKR